MQTIRLIIVDDHEIVRSGLRLALSTEKDIEIVAEANDGKEAVRECRKTNADIMLLDLQMPVLDGFDAMPEVFSFRPALRILVLTMHDNETFAERAIRMGAKGYLLKTASIDTLTLAIRKIHAGETFIDPEIMKKLAMRHIAGEEKSLLAQLTENEFNVLKKLCKLISLTDIAREMGLSISSVSTYKRRIMNKLSIRNSADLTRFAIKNGFFE